MSEVLQFFATTPKGLELLLVEELKTLGAHTAAEKLAGVVFTGDLSVAYKACLWSRLANRILMPLKKFPAETPSELYEGVQTILWDEHLHPEATLHINFVSSQSEITHTLFGAQKVKDAIVDQLRRKYNTRPSITRDKPDLSVHVYLHKNVATISIDLSGESLHRRGYRLAQVEAPLKENLAAAILLRGGWKAIAESGGALMDPMCGSGTLLIEAAGMAGNIAPGLARHYFGFNSWKKHNATLWNELVAAAKASQTLEKIPPIVGYDEDTSAIKAAFANIERAGMLGRIHVEKRELNTFTPKQNVTPGLVATNPPYGERLGETVALKKLYGELGAQLKNNFIGWRAAVFTGNPELGKTMGLRAERYYALYNGAIPCQLLLFNIEESSFVERSAAADNKRIIAKAQRAITESQREAVQAFINRIRKNVKHLKRKASRENISKYRIYDADLPEYAVAIDFEEENIIVREYPRAKNVDKIKSEARLQSILAVLPEALNILPEKIYLIRL